MTTAPARAPQTDTVDVAAATPDQEQPFAELGLKPDEYQRIRDILGRRPTAAELAMYSVMWSEHCSYKSSKNHLRQFGDKTTDAMKEHLLVGIGENAGVVDIGDGWAVTFKVESHNHPSYVEPYQGAATGVGGIVRDIISMGARPVAVMDQLRFGAVDHPDTARVVHGVVAGVGGYGNSLGLPNIGGELVFDASYQGNPLVNALCLGVLRHEDIHLANASGAGNKVVLFGARTGGDGIGGASILASETFDDTKPSKRPSVQVGDPFMEKVLIECCLELYAARVVEGIQDLGAAGISCATSELASNGDGGMHVDLENVLLRDPTLTAGEILMSESQERMMAVVRPDQLDAFLAITGKWDVETAVIGEVTGTGPPHHRPPRRAHRRRRPEDGRARRPGLRPPVRAPGVAGRRSTRTPSAVAARRRRPTPSSAPRCCELLASPNLASKAWVTNQYDRFVQGNTALAQPDDSGVIRVDETTGLGVALATDANGRYAKLDPYTGAQLALAEAYRNVATTGARPLAVTDCLNFGSPEHPDSMWQLVEAIRGLADACQVLEVPVTGGNVSLYNGTGEPGPHRLRDPPDARGRRARRARRRRRRHPVGLDRARPGRLPAGHHARRARRVGLGRRRARPPRRAAAGRGPRRPSAGWPRSSPTPAATTSSTPRTTCRRAAWSRRSSSRACASASACRCRSTPICARDGVTPFEALFSESTARVLVAVPRSEEVRLVDLCTARGVPALRLGETAESCSPGAGTPTDDADHVHGPAVEVAGPVHAAADGGPRGPRGDAPALLRLTARRGRRTRHEVVCGR